MPFTLGVVSVTIGISILTTNILIYNKMLNIHNKNAKCMAYVEVLMEEERMEEKKVKIKDVRDWLDEKKETGKIPDIGDYLIESRYMQYET